MIFLLAICTDFHYAQSASFSKLASGICLSFKTAEISPKSIFPGTSVVLLSELSTLPIPHPVYAYHWKGTSFWPTLGKTILSSFCAFSHPSPAALLSLFSPVAYWPLGHVAFCLLLHGHQGHTGPEYWRMGGYGRPVFFSPTGQYCKSPWITFST